MDDRNSNESKRRRDESTTSPKQHTRFDQEDNGVDDVQIDPSNDEAGQPSSSSAGVSKSSKRRKRKRKHTPADKKGGTTTGSSSGNKIFNGLMVALSTLESSQQQSNTTTDNSKDAADNDPYNYKSIKNQLQTLGATLSPQVHKRVHYLIATDGAVQNLTRRVRQALKRNVDIVDVAWVKECQEKEKRVDVANYLRNDLAESLLAEKEKEKKGKGANKKTDEGEGSDVPGEDNAGWSAPIQLDCCCVCHENGDDNCPWCINCNLTLARKANQCFPVK